MLLNRLFVIVILMLSGAGQVQAGDPTRPPSLGAGKAKPVYQALSLTMILRDSANMRAIINESVVGVTDVVAGARVIAIKEDSVVLRRAGQNITLRMPLAEVRKDSGND